MAKKFALVFSINCDEYHAHSSKCRVYQIKLPDQIAPGDTVVNISTDIQKLRDEEAAELQMIHGKERLP